MRLADYKGEEALDLLADILEPASEILTDEEIRDDLQNDTVLLIVVRKILKKHKKAVLEIMRKVEGDESYEPNFFSLPFKLVELFSSPEMKMLFQPQGQMNEKEPFGSATANTEVREN